MTEIVGMMLAAGNVSALPARASWPVHRAVAWLGVAAQERGVVLDLDIQTESDPAVLLKVLDLDDSIYSLAEAGLIQAAGQRHTARWAIDQDKLGWARVVMEHQDDELAEIIRQAGQRLATWASTSLKNAETAAELWASTDSSARPTLRQPALLDDRY